MASADWRPGEPKNGLGGGGRKNPLLIWEKEWPDAILLPRTLEGTETGMNFVFRQKQ